MNTIPNNVFFLALKEESSNSEAKADSFSDYFKYFQLYFHAYLEDMYLPLAGIIFPYGAISDPFNSAFFQYIAEDLKAFQEKLANLADLKDGGEEFLNVSYEDLLNTPVDDGAESTKTTPQHGTENAVVSQEVDFTNFGTGSSSFLLYREGRETTVQSGLLHATSTQEEGIIPSQYYVFNISQGAMKVPSSEEALEDPPPVELGTLFRFGNFNGLLDNLGFQALIRGFNTDGLLPRGETGIIPLLNGFLSQGLVNGHFTYTVNPGAVPIADEFSFFVSDLKGNLLGKGQAFISQIQDLTFYAPIVLDYGNKAISFSVDGSLLQGAAVSNNDALSIMSVFNPDIGLAGLYVPIKVQNPIDFVSTLMEPGANTAIHVTQGGNLTFSSTVIDVNNPDTFPSEIDIKYIVQNEHGNSALATATIVPVIKPVVLDLTDEGFNLVSAEDSSITLGQLTSSQNQTAIGWVGEGNGVLMFDYDNSHQLSHLNQISFISYVKGAQSDLEGLRYFDSNHNGLLDLKDDSFNQFGVLLHDGSYMALSEMGIVSLVLDSQQIYLNENGNSIFGLSLYQTSDGNSHLAADVGFGLGKNNPVLALNDVLDEAPLMATQTNAIEPIVQGDQPLPVLHVQTVIEQLAQETPALA